MEDKRKLLNDFLTAFPLETLSEMPLDKYTNLNRSDSFCYWVESRTYELGSIWGGSSYKFGIYKYNEKPKDTRDRFMCDDTYAWYTKNGNTAEEAYALVRGKIVKIANHARNGEFEAIDSITTFGDVFKWKIAFLYSMSSWFLSITEPCWRKHQPSSVWTIPMTRVFQRCNASFSKRKAQKTSSCSTTDY